jgi:hypothetical protein
LGTLETSDAFNMGVLLIPFDGDGGVFRNESTIFIKKVSVEQ